MRPLPSQRGALVVLLAGALSLISFLPAGAQIYVKANASGAGNGTSWTDAFKDLQDALAAAAPGQEIWVAEGTYKPTAGTDRSATFQLLNNVALYGGFAGTEVSLGEREVGAHPTVLSGDIGVYPYAGDDSYHVVTAGGTDATAVLDGFIVTAGNADGASPDNLGGGVYIESGSPTIANTVIEGNAANNGGGIFARNGSIPTLVNVVVYNNTAANGGGISIITGSDAVLTNVTIVANTATSGGGGISDITSAPLITNAIVWGNTAPDGPQIRNPFTSALTLSHSLVPGSGGSGAGWDATLGVDGGGNLDGDPIFVDSGAGDLHLTLGSQCLDTGDDSAPNLAATDLDGAARIFGAAVDMGAYEASITCPGGALIYVDAAATGVGDGTSWADGFTEVRDALGAARLCPGIQEVWVAEGTYKPTLGSSRSATFRLRSGLAVYGGFTGTETQRSERDWTAHPTILSGDVGTGTNIDDSYSIVTAESVDATGVLDGFTIKRSYGGIGGGVHVIGGSPTLQNLIVGCDAQEGGGVYNDGGDPHLTNVWISSSCLGNGGGIYNASGNPVLVNVVFRNCTNYNQGGGIYCQSGQVLIVNGTFQCNGFNPGTSLYNAGGTVTIKNTIMWDDRTLWTITPEIVNAGGTTYISTSLIESCGGSGGGWNSAYGVDQGGNIDVYPMFFDDCNDPRVANASPAVNAGDNGAPNLPATDFDGNPRIADGTIDIGAFESQYICPPGTRLYVRKNATGAGDGSTWADAFTELRDALTAVCTNVNEVWVAEGTYTPTSGTDRTATFRVGPGLSVYGGFAGSETSLSERDPLAHPTILSGNIGAPALASDNSYHVIDVSYTLAADVLDGFTVRDGTDNGDGAGLYNWGGDLTVRGVRFLQNSTSGSGGGALTVDGDPTFMDVECDSNSAAYGGGMSFIRSAATVVNALFFHNTSGNGGGLYLNMANILLANPVFVDNHAGTGGAIYNAGSSPLIGGGSFALNTAWNCGSSMANIIAGSASYPTVVNSILWDSDGTTICDQGDPGATFSYSIVRGSNGSGASWDTSLGIDAGHNLDADPMFIDPANDNLRLLAGSPAIDSGFNNGPLSAYDPDGRPRVIGGVVDRGAYEWTVGSGVGDTPPLTGVPGIKAVYPNPFNPELTVAYETEARQDIRIVVYDVAGRRVREVFAGSQGAGLHRARWEAVNDRGTRVASGVYFVEVRSTAWRDRRKVVLLK